MVLDPWYRRHRAVHLRQHHIVVRDDERAGDELAQLLQVVLVLVRVNANLGQTPLARAPGADLAHPVDRRPAAVGILVAFSVGIPLGAHHRLRYRAHIVRTGNLRHHRVDDLGGYAMQVRIDRKQHFDNSERKGIAAGGAVDAGAIEDGETFLISAHIHLGHGQGHRNLLPG